MMATTAPLSTTAAASIPSEQATTLITSWPPAAAAVAAGTGTTTKTHIHRYQCTEVAGACSFGNASKRSQPGSSRSK